MFNFIRKRLPFSEVNDGEELLQRTRLSVSNIDRVRQIIRHELFRQQVDDSAETFEQADDFDLDDGDEWVSPYEENFEPIRGAGAEAPAQANKESQAPSSPGPQSEPANLDSTPAEPANV